MSRVQAASVGWNVCWNSSENPLDGIWIQDQKILTHAFWARNTKKHSKKDRKKKRFPNMKRQKIAIDGT